ncbi:hypothetical protein B0H14DRAFT_3431578 [Mycena olivaceomarginata]|nr:hypothetical protein B0H14DRAFT_3431578 [Mycena olivaceomarginata]
MEDGDQGSGIRMDVRATAGGGEGTMDVSTVQARRAHGRAEGCVQAIPPMRVHTDVYAGVRVRIVFGCQSRHDRQLALPGAILLRHRFHTQMMMHGASLARATSSRPPCQLVLARFPIFLAGDFVSFPFSIFRFFDLFPFLQTWDTRTCATVVATHFRGYSWVSNPTASRSSSNTVSSPLSWTAFLKTFFLFFCFFFFTIATPARPRPSRICQSSRRFVIRLALAARASLAALRTPTLVTLGTVRAFISRVSRPVPVGPSYKRSSLQHLHSLPMSAGYPIPHSS